MLSVDEEGNISHVNAVVSSGLRMPHKREVIRALRGIHSCCNASGRNQQLEMHLDVVCRYFGVTVEQLTDGNKETN